MEISQSSVVEIGHAPLGKRVSFARKEERRLFTRSKSEHDGDLIYRGFPHITNFEIMRAGWEEKPTRKLGQFEAVIDLSKSEIEAFSGTLMTCGDIARIVEAKLANADKEDHDPNKANYSVNPDTWYSVSEHDIKNFRRYNNISSSIEFWRNELDNVHKGELTAYEVAVCQMAERNRLITEKGSNIVYFKQARNVDADFMYIAKIAFDEVIRHLDDVDTEEVACWRKIVKD
jgi:hypothetical protein